jgi:hypothetical protein
MVKKLAFLLIASFGMLLCGGTACVEGGGPSKHLRIVLIRHGEKPDAGNNLNCKGLNRALALPGVLYPRFGRPDYTYVAAIRAGSSADHARMLETIVPFAVKYGLTISDKYDEDDVAGLAKDVLKREGTVLIVWDHSRLESVARALGVVDNTLTWSPDDYDGIWVITFSKGIATLEKQRQGLTPAEACPF